MPGSRIDRAAWDEQTHGYWYMCSIEHIRMRTCASIRSFWRLSGAVLLLFVPGMSLVVHAQEEHAGQEPTRLPTQVAVETFPLEPAPQAAECGQRHVAIGRHTTKPRKTESSSSRPAAKVRRIADSAGPSGALEEEGNPTFLELPDNLSSVRRNGQAAQAIRRGFSRSGPGNPVSGPLDKPQPSPADSIARKEAHSASRAPEAAASGRTRPRRRHRRRPDREPARRGSGSCSWSDRCSSMSTIERSRSFRNWITPDSIRNDSPLPPATNWIACGLSLRSFLRIFFRPCSRSWRQR